MKLMDWPKNNLRDFKKGKKARQTAGMAICLWSRMQHDLPMVRRRVFVDNQGSWLSARKSNVYGNRLTFENFMALNR